MTLIFRSVFFDLFAEVEPYISVTITHGTPCEFSSVGNVEFLGCLGTDVLSGVRKQRTCNSLDPGAYPSNADDKAAGRNSFNFTVLDNII